MSNWNPSSLVSELEKALAEHNLPPHQLEALQQICNNFGRDILDFAQREAITGPRFLSLLFHIVHTTAFLSGGLIAANAKPPFHLTLLSTTIHNFDEWLREAEADAREVLHKHGLGS